MTPVTTDVMRFATALVLSRCIIRMSSDGRYVWASEVRALLRSGIARNHVDSAAVSGFLLYGSVPHPLTWHSDVRCIEPGTCLEISGHGASEIHYWSVKDVAGTRHADVPARTLAEAVGCHLISDAPLGVFLSSGVDSTGLVALARKAGAHLRTLTVIFDEADHSEETTGTAKHFETDHTQIRITAEDFMDELPHVLSAMDQPTADGLNTFFVSKAAHAAGLKTVLSGLGADEMFHGYRHYRWLEDYRREWNAFAHLPRFARRALAGLAASGGAWMGNESWGRLRGLTDATPASLYLAMRGFFAPDVVARLTGRSVLQPAVPESAAHGFADETTFQATEISRYLHDQLLRDADVFGMAWSLEIRVPYLDDEVVAMALAAPSDNHKRQGINKPMLVDAIGDESVLAAARRPKTGFAFPLDRWMRRYSRELLERALQADLDGTEIRRLWTAFERGHINAVRAWALVVLGSQHAGEHR